ncbi:YncE family protein [Streptomyces sp. V2I9]|uniref:YncE family protein n=1 Tax=Streptomyces sp. V2I9 TaxID=3042304 RepID=UPI0027841C41|nr:YncE family protein [Streptomyces sp. V2I9]MDQ0985257.1 YVTN family beta-propeller protein [Streptomyces sp. V2I9]
MTGERGPRAARRASHPGPGSPALGPRAALRPPGPRTRRLALGLLAAALLAGCATGTTEAAPDPAATPHASAATGTVAAPDPSRAPAGRTPEGTLLVTDFGGDTVTFVDPGRDGSGAGGAPIASVKAGTAPYGLVVGEDGRAWVATAEGVAVIDTQRRTRLALVPYATESGPVTTGEYRGGGMGIAMAPDGKHVYVGVNVPGGDGAVEVIDTTTREVTGTAAVGLRPFDVDVSPDGREVYATDHDSFDVTAVDADSLETRRMEVAPYGTEGGLGSWLKPHHAVVRPEDGKLLLPFEGERLAVLDPRTGEVAIEPMTANTHQHGAALTPDGTLLVVGTGPIGADDEDPSLTVRDPGGTERTVPLDGPHEDVAVSPDGRTAYVTGGFTRDGYWNGITVVDLDDEGSAPIRLKAGNRPLDIAVL